MPTLTRSLILSTIACIAGCNAADSTDQMMVTGHVSTRLMLSSAPSSAYAQVANSQATNITGSDGIRLLDFGDLTTKSNEVTGVLVLRIKGNTAFQINVAQSAFSATHLHFHGQLVESGARGHFLRMRLGTPTGTGSLANAAGTEIVGQLRSGLILSEVSPGQVTAQSTLLCRGSSPSMGGTATSSDNAVDIPLYFSAPGGMEMGPADGSATRGTFRSNIQIGIFPRG